ncbi:MAG: peptide-methionine (R)-S-oxide reductase [Ignavibacteriales bacterium]|nr:peptide-methionine (R)-S-oxide reductase [Ignavibacteriales bacterium]
MKNLLSIAVMLFAISQLPHAVLRDLLIKLKRKIHYTTKDKKVLAKTIEGENADKPLIKSEEEWKKELTPEQYKVLREKGTERPFTGEYDEFFEEGTYSCAACGNLYLIQMRNLIRDAAGQVIPEFLKMIK